MMFQGSAHVKKSEHFQLVERAGGTLNGSTHDDYTNYYETIPSNRLNLALWLEADRMRSLAVTQENLENQRATVKEEKRLRVDNQPYAPTFRNAIILPFDSATCFAYAHSTIGSMEDRSEEHTSELQSLTNLVCRLLLEKKKQKKRKRLDRYAGYHAWLTGRRAVRSTKH